MAYEFPHDLAERVHARMASRGLNSADDVLREALDALDELEERKSRRWNERNEIALEQSRLGLSKPLDLDALLNRVDERVAKHDRNG